MSVSLSSRQEFGFQFSIVARRWRRRIEERLVRAGLTDATWLPLVHLHAIGHDCTQKVLAERIGIDGSSLVRLLDILTQKGLVMRRADPSDARARRVQLTAQGKGFVAELLEILWEHEAELLTDVSDDDLEVAMRVLQQIDARVTQQSTDGTGQCVRI